MELLRSRCQLSRPLRRSLIHLVDRAISHRHQKIGHRALWCCAAAASAARRSGPREHGRQAARSFGSKRDAEQWLTVIESEVLRGDWSDPLAGRVPLGEYGEKWIEEHKLGQRTREEYDRLWRRHVDPFLGRIELAEISTDIIRSWRATLLRAGRS